MTHKASQILQHTAVAAFCAWPVLNFIIGNFAGNIISVSTLLALGTIFALAFTLNVIAQHMLKLHSAKYVLPVGFLSFFSFGLWLDFFEHNLRLEQYTAVFALTAISVQFFLVNLVILQVASAYTGKRIAALGFLTLFLPTLVSGGIGLLNFTEKNLNVERSVTIGNQTGVISKPNVYFIILDMYAREDVLQEHFKINNSPFLEALEERGFITDEQSFSNYPTTPLSLSTTFNMDYYSFTKDYSVDLIRGKNPVVSFFRQHGYQFIFIDSGGNSQITCGGFEDICLGSGNIEDDIALLLGMTPLWRAMNSNSLARYFEALYLLTDLEQSVIEASKRLLVSGQPGFIFAHILSPHEPARFNAACELLFTINPGLGKPSAQQYRNDLPCLNAQVLRSVDFILQNDDTRPIILIQSDHGIRNIEFSSDDELLDLKNLMTFLLPDSCKPLHYKGMTPVNNFRLVISCITGRPFAPVDDKLLIWDGVERNHFRQVDTRGKVLRDFGS